MYWQKGIAMQATYTSKNYDPKLVQKRYVRYNAYDKTFHFCEVGEDRRYDLRQGLVEQHELPEPVAAEALKYNSSYVDWPY